MWHVRYVCTPALTRTTVLEGARYREDLSRADPDQRLDVRGQGSDQPAQLTVRLSDLLPREMLDTCVRRYRVTVVVTAVPEGE